MCVKKILCSKVYSDVQTYSYYRVAVFQTKMEIIDKGVEKLQVKKITKISLTG